MNKIIVEMSDKRVTAIPVLESNEKLFDVHVSSLSYGKPPESPETAPYYRLLREGVISKLERAQSNLSKGFSFRLYEGYRNPEFQKKLFKEQLIRTTKLNPIWGEVKCYKEASKLASPLKTFDGTLITPPHSTGGALDIEIVDINGKVIDFGMETKDWFNVDPQLCESYVSNLGDEAKENREMLISTLESEGFVNYPREWWHFSYGDQYWAFNKNKPNAIYDRIELD